MILFEHLCQGTAKAVLGLGQRKIFRARRCRFCMVKLVSDFAVNPFDPRPRDIALASLALVRFLTPQSFQHLEVVGLPRRYQR